MMNIRRFAVIALAVALLAVPPSAQARVEITEDLEMSGEIFNYNEFRWGGKRGPDTFSLAVAPGVFLGPEDLGVPSNGERYDNVNAVRTELLLEFLYRGIPHVTPVVKLRPFWDASFGIEDESYRDISRNWRDNITNPSTDKWDPLVREAYVDLNFHPFFLRAGRQIVTWGRSDGVTVLDVVNPRNFRNPLTFEQERFMIPQWMVNASYDFGKYSWKGGTEQELQLIWNLEYLPSRFPGFQAREEGQHPWTLNVVDFADQVINASEGVFGERDFFDENDWEEGSFFDKNEAFLRWRARTTEGLGPLSDMTYSFHYAYLFEDIPFYTLKDRIDAGFAINIAGPRAIGGGIDFERHRYQLAGFSFDKALTWLPGQFQGTVLRGEFGYTFGNQFYEPDLGLVESNQATFLIGLDQYLYLTPRSWVETPWFVSFQYWRDEILDEPGQGDFTNLGSVACDAQPGCGRTGYIIGGASNVFNGLRDQNRDVVTLFMFNDFLPGKTLRVEFFALHEFGNEQSGTWLRFLLGYNFTTSLSARLGTNLIWGETNAFFGQFRKNDVVFTELKYTF